MRSWKKSPEIELDEDRSFLEVLQSTSEAGEKLPAKSSEASKLSAGTLSLIDELFGESEDEDPNAIDFSLLPMQQVKQTNPEQQVQEQGAEIAGE